MATVASGPMSRDEARRLRRAAFERHVRSRAFAPSQWRGTLSWGVIALLIAGATTVIVMTGGAPNPFMHLYYIPILYAAARHGVVGGVVGGLLAGVAAGPFMPDPTAGGLQPFSDWIVRFVLFVMVGAVAAWFAREQPRPIDIMVRDVWIGQLLRSAVRRGKIAVHFQPLVSLADGSVLGSEALCRWPGAGPAMTPDVFIPAAERSGLIRELGKEVMRRAAEQGRAWGDGGRAPFLLNVNVSGIELGADDFLEHLAAMVEAHRDDGFRLCIEITESAIVASPERALRVLEAARALGVAVALDDFGTGYSSLTYLADFPIDIIKIDRAFVAGVDVDPTSRALIAAVVELARALGAQTVAEGIERPEQLRAVAELGCTMGQGFHLGRPEAAESLDWSSRLIA